MKRVGISALLLHRVELIARHLRPSPLLAPLRLRIGPTILAARMTACTVHREVRGAVRNSFRIFAAIVKCGSTTWTTSYSSACPISSDEPRSS